MAFRELGNLQSCHCYLPTPLRKINGNVVQNANNKLKLVNCSVTRE